MRRYQIIQYGECDDMTFILLDSETLTVVTAGTRAECEAERHRLYPSDLSKPVQF